MKKVSGGISILLASLFAAFAVVGCREQETASTMPGSNVVAVVAGVPISKEALSTELSRRFGTSGKVTPAQKKEALDALIRKEALYARAVAAGFDRKPEIEARIRNMVAERFADQAFAAVAEPVSDLIVSNTYLADRAQFEVPAAVRYSSLVISVPAKASPEARAALEQKALGLVADAKADPGSFAALVARASEDRATRYRGGDAGWVSLDGKGVDRALADELKKLSKPGDIGGPVRTEQGMQIIQLTGLRPASVRPFAEVRDRIRHELIRKNAVEAERRSAMAIRDGLKIEVFQERVDSVSPPAGGESGPPSGPGGTRAEVSQTALKQVSE